MNKTTQAKTPAKTTKSPARSQAAKTSSSASSGPGSSEPSFQFKQGPRFPSQKFTPLRNPNAMMPLNHYDPADFNDQTSPFFGLPPMGTQWVSKELLRYRIESYGQMMINEKQERVIISSPVHIGGFGSGFGSGYYGNQGNQSYMSVLTLEQWQEETDIRYSVTAA